MEEAETSDATKKKEFAKTVELRVRPSTLPKINPALMYQDDDDDDDDEPTALFDRVQLEVEAGKVEKRDSLRTTRCETPKAIREDQQG